MKTLPLQQVPPHIPDKRVLVNLDLYKNEIRFLQNKLDKMKGLRSVPAPHAGKIRDLRQGLHLAGKKLHRFCIDYNMNINPSMQDEPGTDKPGTENFFIHLQSFENEFKEIRDKVNEFTQSYIG